MLTVASPLLALAGIAIKLSSRGPVLFRARRVGLQGYPFTMFKLRTMHDGRPGVSPISGGRDNRVFPAGRLLRRFKLDELPQLANVAMGQMAFVGPRPEAVSIVDEHYTPFMRESLAVLPGLTSPGTLSYFAEEAQLSDDPTERERVYAAQLLPRKIALDLVYIRNRSSCYDAELVIRTLASIAGVTKIFRRHQEWEQTEACRLLQAEAGEPGQFGGAAQ
jgi:lipopolysaccharide/colanic/teichoic acid biosynthesis glycosyltransferase